MGGSSSSAFSTSRGTATLALNIDSEVVTLIAQEAKARKKSASKLANEALRAYLEEIADHRAVKAALRRKEKSIPWPEARKRLGLDR